jgi:hypothetical protein
MWNWFNCYLSGRHEYGVSREPGAVFLRCVHCGRRSAGWAIGAPQTAAVVTGTITEAARPFTPAVPKVALVRRKRAPQ